MDKAPYTDIRVRIAFQMAIDLNTIAKTYYSGQVDGTPCGLVNPSLTGYYTPFDKWPASLKAEYTYNPDGATGLRCGFPKGFNTNVVAPTPGSDIDLLQVLKSYLANIGVNMDIKLMETTAFTAFTRTSKSHDALAYSNFPSTALAYPPSIIISRRVTTSTANLTQNNDAKYDAMVAKFLASTDAEEQRQILVQANDYALAQHWAVNILPTVNYVMYQPWFKGFSGEIAAATVTTSGPDAARFWIDQKVKSAAGH